MPSLGPVVDAASRLAVSRTQCLQHFLVSPETSEHMKDLDFSRVVKLSVFFVADNIF